VGLDEANAMVLRLLDRYEQPIAENREPRGKSFPECYQLPELTPTDEYQHLWERKKEDLANVGLRFA
jgi:hypothetical protein